MTHPRDDVGRIIEALIEKGLVGSDTTPPSRRESDRPWFIGVVLGSAGWLAGVFVLFFVGMLFEPSTAAEFAIAGIVMLAAAYGLYASDRESAFFGQLALALSIAGQFAMGAAAYEMTHSVAGTAALITLMQCALLAVMPNRLAKLIAAFFACIAWAIAIRFAWWGEPDYAAANREVVQPGPALAGWGVIWIPIVALAWVLIGTESKWMSNGLHRIARPALSGLLLSLAVGTLASEPLGTFEFGSPEQDRFNWLAVWPLLSTGAAMFAAFCAFRLRSNALLGICAVAMLLHVVHFYYLLGLTLLLKSCIMIALGIVLLGISQTLRRESQGGQRSVP